MIEIAKDTYSNPLNEAEFEEAKKETLNLFESQEIKDSACRAIDQYPNLQYHNRQHALNVINATDKMVDILCKFGAKIGKDQKQALLLAAAWHDAGFDERQVGKEDYAIELFKQDKDKYDLPIDDDSAGIVESAIKGTIMNQSNEDRSRWGKIMHYADTAYIFDNPTNFMKHVMEFRDEECPDMSWPEFIALQEKFLPKYKENMAEAFRSLGFGEEFIDCAKTIVDLNKQAIVGCKTEAEAREH